MENHREFNKPTYFLFIDYVKAFDRVSRLKLWNILERRGIPLHLIEIIKSFYNGSNINIKISGKLSNKFITTNQGVRQGCSLSPILFNLYLDDAIRIWKADNNFGFRFKNAIINNLLYADDQVLISGSENILQKAFYNLSIIMKQYNMTVSAEKTKVLAFCGKHAIRSKIIYENKSIEQVNVFNYLGCQISFFGKYDLDKKILTFQNMCGTIVRTLKNKTRRETQLKFYKVMAVPALLYGAETWVLTKKDRLRIQAAEMKFLRAVSGYKLSDQRRNEDIRHELNIFNLNDKIKEYREKWIEHLNRQPEDNIAKQSLNYKVKGRRSIGRPNARWIDQMT